MSRRARAFEQYKRATITETTEAILSAHSREVKSSGRTQIKRDPNRPEHGQKVAVELQDRIVDGELKSVPTPVICTCSKPMNPAKAQRIAATLHRSKRS